MLFAAHGFGQERIDKDIYYERKADKYIKVDKISDGKHDFYDASKRVCTSGTFKNELLWNGKKFFYDDKGILARLAIYKEGKYVGDALVE